jgi:hypothetical protein
VNRPVVQSAGVFRLVVLGQQFRCIIGVELVAELGAVAIHEALRIGLDAHGG